MRATTSGLLLTTALLASPATGAAQAAPGTASTDARWQAWIGCWQPAGAQGARAVCVLPAGGAAVELVTVEDAKVASRERIDASGESRPATREACSGTERARWSPDGRRIYLHAEHACDGVRFRSTGVMSIVAGGEWIDVRGVSVAGGPADVKVRRYRVLTDETVLPAALAAEAAAALAARPTVRAAARANAAAPLVTEHVAEAVREVDAGVVEALLLERGEGFELDAKRLVALDEAGVPDRVIDAVVALSYPSRFAINVAGRDAASRPLAPASGEPGVTDTMRVDDFSAGQRQRYCRNGRLPLSYCDDYLAYGASPYGTSPYGYTPFGFSPWGVDSYGYGYGIYNRRPPVIVITEPGTTAERGRVVKGKGYTRGGSSSGEAAAPRSGGSSPNSDRATTRTSGGSSSGSSGKSSAGSSRSGETRSSGGSRSGGSNDGERKAKPRNP